MNTYGDVCNAGSNTISLSYAGGWCKGAAAGGYTLHNVVLSNITLAATVENMLVNTEVAGMFNWLAST